MPWGSWAWLAALLPRWGLSGEMHPCMDRSWVSSCACSIFAGKFAGWSACLRQAARAHALSTADVGNRIHQSVTQSVTTCMRQGQQHRAACFVQVQQSPFLSGAAHGPQGFPAPDGCRRSGIWWRSGGLPGQAHGHHRPAPDGGRLPLPRRSALLVPARETCSAPSRQQRMQAVHLSWQAAAHVTSFRSAGGWLVGL